MQKRLDSGGVDQILIALAILVDRARGCVERSHPPGSFGDEKMRDPAVVSGLNHLFPVGRPTLRAQPFVSVQRLFKRGGERRLGQLLGTATQLATFETVGSAMNSVRR